MLTDVTSVERLALGVARVTVGTLTKREHKLVIELAHFFSGYILDQHHTIQQLESRVIDLVNTKHIATAGDDG